MKKLIFLSLISLFYMQIDANPILTADTIRIDGKLVLWLMVDGYEAGYEYGHFLGGPIADVMENYVINHTFGGAFNYQMARQIFDQKFIYDEKYQLIAQGMLDGMEDFGVSIYSPTLGEDLTYKDVLIANAIPDFTSFGLLNTDGPGCSDLMSWGEATMEDPELNGELVISRNLDWENNPYLINNALVIIWGNLSGAGQRFITFGFTGMIGALSGINESGVVTFQNMGNYNSSPTGTGFYPVNLAQRDGLESWDYNNDGICSPRDVTDAVRSHNMSSTFIVNSAGPNSGDFPAEILEIHNSFGDTIRTSAGNPAFFGDNLVSTNHFRLLKPPAYCYRYNRISDSLEASNRLDIHRNWRVLQAAGVSTNLQTIQYIPYSQMLRFSFAEPGTPSYQIEPTEVRVDTLFSIVGINELISPKKSLVQISPNPTNGYTVISLVAPEDCSVNFLFYNSSGEVIEEKFVTASKNEAIKIGWERSDLRSGVYICNVQIRSPENRLLHSGSAKIIINK